MSSRFAQIGRGDQFPILLAARVSGTFSRWDAPAGLSPNHSNSGVFLVVTNRQSG
jgi:hypothetical protein